MRGAVGGGRRVAPREVLVVELHVGKVVGLEVGDPVARLDLDHRPRLHPDKISGAVQADVAVQRLRGLRTVEPSGRQGQVQGQAGAELHARISVGLLDVVGHAGPQPGQERICGRWAAHAALTSWAGRTWMAPEREGSACTLRRITSAATASLEKVDSASTAVLSRVEAIVYRSGETVTLSG